MNDFDEAMVLELRRVCFTYQSGVWHRNPVRALRGVTLSLCSGEVAGLVGVNGAGKTTLLEIAVGARGPTNGTVRWFAREEWDADVRARVGFCPDAPSLPPFLGVRETLEFFAGLRRLSKRSVSHQVGSLLGRLGLTDLSRRRIAKLSRGNLVRVGIAQALLGTPDLLIFDESFASLDPKAQADLRAILREEARRGAAVLISSHQLAQVEKVADRVFVLQDGSLSDTMDRHELYGSRERSLESILLGTGSPSDHIPQDTG